MKKSRSILAIFIAMLFLTVFGVVHAQEKEPIRIGVLLDMTGIGADYGPKFHAVQEYFLNEIGNKIAGRPIKVFEEDTGTTPTGALDKARKLVESDKVHILTGTMFGHITHTIATFAAEKKIPHLIWSTAHYAAVANGWSFATTYPAEVVGYIAGKYINDKGYKTATCIGPDYISGYKFIGGAAQAFIDAGGKIIQTQWVPLGTSDFAPYISAMKRADVCIFWLPDITIGGFWKQYAEFGLLDKVPLVITEGDAIFNEWLITLDPKTFVGKIRGRVSYTSDIDNPLNKKFVAAWRSKKKIDPDAYDAEAYETWIVIAKALEATRGDTNPEKLRQAIRGLKIVGPAGPVRISKEGYPYRPSYIFELAKKDDKLFMKKIKEYPEQSPIYLRPGIGPEAGVYSPPK